MPKTYVTFGSGHSHEVNGQIFDRNCVASIECEDFADGRAKAFDLFGPKFCTTYFDKPPRMDYFFNGIVEVE